MSLTSLTSAFENAFTINPTIRWSIAVLCALIATMVIFYNLTIILRFYISGRHGSPVPLLGGIFGLLFFCFARVHISWFWWLVPAMIDYGLIPLGSSSLSREFRRRSAH
jgi:hypothetical protein